MPFPKNKTKLKTRTSRFSRSVPMPLCSSEIRINPFRGCLGYETTPPKWCHVWLCFHVLYPFWNSKNLTKLHFLLLHPAPKSLHLKAPSVHSDSKQSSGHTKRSPEVGPPLGKKKMHPFPFLCLRDEVPRFQAASSKMGFFWHSPLQTTGPTNQTTHRLVSFGFNQNQLIAHHSQRSLARNGQLLFVDIAR